MFVLEKGGFGTLRQIEKHWLPSRQDVFVPQRFIDQFKLRDGMLVHGRLGRGQKHKHALIDVLSIDGLAPNEARKSPRFKDLVTIDPDFHYAVGDVTGDVSMRILDIVCPVGRGQRGLIVAPPRSGKTTLMRQFAKGIEEGYPEVQLFVLLVDERPEEATEWVRSIHGKGHVFVSTADETPKNHVQLAETVWKRATRLVELGQDVVILLDSITRLARAYNNMSGGSGRTMSGGLDSRAMERPRQIFGSARNTEMAGSLTILGTALVDTGSRMDQLIFEEFKGTGNMELVLNRKLADRRIFPAIDVEKSGTRKDEKLISSKRLKYINTLRRVLARMNFIEAMELLVTKLEDVETNDEFLKRFEVDPEA
jgi:transcription termination factor Rho